MEAKPFSFATGRTALDSERAPFEVGSWSWAGLWGKPWGSNVEHTPELQLLL